MRNTALARLLTCVPSTALAVPNVYLVEPESGSLYWGWVPYGPEPAATQRIRIRNDGTTGRIVEVSTGSNFEVAATGGDLGPRPGGLYDVRCALDSSDAMDELRLSWCEGNCEENEGSVAVWLNCAAILATDDLTFPPPLYQDESGAITVPFTNQRPEPVTIDGAAAEAPFAAALEGGPITLAQEKGGSVQVSYQPSGPGRIVGVVDILAGDDVVGRTRPELVTLPQIAPASVNMGSVPLGVTYAPPVTIRGSSDLSRTITAVSSDQAGVELPGLVGRTMAPREVIDAVATVQAGALGELSARLSVELDVAQGDSMQLSATVVPAELSVEVDDATPSDGLLELGTVSITAETSDRTVTLRNPGSEPVALAPCFSQTPGFSIVGACPASVPAGGSVDVAIRFDPAAAASQATERGDVQANIAFQLASFRVYRVLAHVRLVEPGAPLVSGDDAVDLGAVQLGPSAGATVVLQNLGQRGFVIDRVEVVGQGFSGTAPGSFRVQRFGRLSIDVAFAPVEEGGANGSLLLYTAGAAEPAVTVPLAGEGVADDPGE